MISPDLHPSGSKLFKARRAFEVPPTFASDYVSDRMDAAADCLSDSFSRHSSRDVQSPNLPDLRLGKALIPDRRPFGLGIVSSVADVLGGHGRPFSLNRIFGVVALTSPSKMLGVTARGRVARMKGVRSIFGRWPVLNLARYSVRQSLLPFGASSHNPIASALPASFPQPALVHFSGIDPIPEARDVMFRISHNSTLARVWRFAIGGSNQNT